MAKISGESKLFAFLAYLLSILGFIIVFLVRRHDQFAMYHAKQSLVLFIAAAILKAIAIIPLLGWFVYVVGSLIVLILWIIGLINALNGAEKPLPIVGKFSKLINL